MHIYLQPARPVYQSGIRGYVNRVNNITRFHVSPKPKNLWSALNLNADEATNTLRHAWRNGGELSSRFYKHHMLCLVTDLMISSSQANFQRQNNPPANAMDK